MKKIITLLSLNLFGLAMLSGYYVCRDATFSDIFTDAHKLNYPSRAMQLDAQRMVRNIVTSNYEIDTTVTETGGLYDFDCSGFTDYLLRYAFFDHYDVIDQAKTVGVNRPATADFYNFFTACSTSQDPAVNDAGWAKIQYITDIRSGDFLVWKNPSNNNGHIMIVTGLAHYIGTKVISSVTYYEYEIVVADSANSGHGADSRNHPDNTTGEGLGIGRLVVGTNASEVIQYYKWSSTSSTPYFYNFAIGRAIPFPA